MITYFMETPILRDGYKVTVEFGFTRGEGETFMQPADDDEFEIVTYFIDDDNVPESKIELTDDENELVYEYLAENYVYEPEQDENY